MSYAIRNFVLFCIAIFPVFQADAAKMAVCMNNAGQLYARPKCLAGDSPATAGSLYNKMGVAQAIAAATDQSNTNQANTAACEARNTQNQATYNSNVAYLNDIKNYAATFGSIYPIPDDNATSATFSNAAQAFTDAYNSIMSGDYTLLPYFKSRANAYISQAWTLYASSTAFTNTRASIQVKLNSVAGIKLTFTPEKCG